MNYEKLSIERFADNLKAGKYASRTGARRAIGKVDWTTKDKDRGRELVERFFGAEGSEKNGAPVAAKAVKASTKKAEKTEASAKPRKVGAPKGPRGKRGPNKATVAKMHSSLPASAHLVEAPDHNKSDRLFIAERVIGASSSAIEAMAKAKAIDSKIDITEMQGAIDAMNASVQAMLGLLDTGSTESKDKVTAEPEEDQPGEEEESREAELFNRTRPTSGGNLGSFAS